jgi:DNA-binding NtrC family response regulator
VDRSWTVLLVDDEPLFLDTLSKLLQRQHVLTLTAPDGSSALSLLRDSDPDAVLLDLKMTGMDGLETLREIKKIRPLTPVIILTGHATLESGTEALKLEAYDFLTKPAKVSKLIETIQEAIRSRRLAEEAIRRDGR